MAQLDPYTFTNPKLLLLQRVGEDRRFFLDHLHRWIPWKQNTIHFQVDVCVFFVCVCVSYSDMMFLVSIGSLICKEFLHLALLIEIPSTKITVDKKKHVFSEQFFPQGTWRRKRWLGNLGMSNLRVSNRVWSPSSCLPIAGSWKLTGGRALTQTIACMWEYS